MIILIVLIVRESIKIRRIKYANSMTNKRWDD